MSANIAGKQSVEKADLRTLERLRKEIDARRVKTHQAIIAYPTPITVCDVQFNHLLDTRSFLSMQLRQIDHRIRRYRTRHTTARH